MQQFTSLHLTVVFIPHHLLMIQLKQLADFVLIEITPLEGVLDYHKKLLIGLLLGVGNYEINYNIEIRMYNFSRKLVVFFIIVFAQSSLGTTYALADLSNATSKSFGSSSSYMKFNNGLLIQWGTKTGAIGFSSLYLPISFLDTNYSVQLTGVSSSKDEVIVYSPTVYITKTVSSFQFATRYIASGGEIAWTGWQFTWFAIGRWK